MCAVPCSGRAHIPVDTYQANLQAIVQKLLAAGVERVMLVTPSPVYDGAPNATPHGEVSLLEFPPPWVISTQGGQGGEGSGWRDNEFACTKGGGCAGYDCRSVPCILFGMPALSAAFCLFLPCAAADCPSPSVQVS